jgi:aspartate aminotransferase
VRADGVPFCSPLSLYDDTCVVYSFGKSLFMQGQRIGYVAVSPRMPGSREKAKLLERLCRIMGYCAPTALMQLAIRELLGKRSPHLLRIELRRKRAATALADAGYELVPPQATFFLYPRSPQADEFAFATRLAERGVLVLPSPLFHHKGHVRLSLTATDDMLERALQTLCDAALRAPA